MCTATVWALCMCMHMHKLSWEGDVGTSNLLFFFFFFKKECLNSTNINIPQQENGLSCVTNIFVSGFPFFFQILLFSTWCNCVCKIGFFCCCLYTRVQCVFFYYLVDRQNCFCWFVGSFQQFILYVCWVF